METIGLLLATMLGMAIGWSWGYFVGGIMCSNCRLFRRTVDEARDKLLKIMQVETRQETYRRVAQVVHLLSRSGRLKEAYDGEAELPQEDHNRDRVHKVS